MSNPYLTSMADMTGLMDSWLAGKDIISKHIFSYKHARSALSYTIMGKASVLVKFSQSAI